MVLIRRFEECVGDLVSSGKIQNPCHLYIGQEAVATGVCAALMPDDWVFSTHRSHGHYIAKGGDLKRLMAELFTRESGCSRGKGGSMHIADPSVGLPGSSAIVGGTISLAAGAALAFTMSRCHRIAVAFFGEGAVNEGVFYETLNIAALYNLPVAFICENNGYSTHMPINRILKDIDISKKAKALGVPALKLDGNNVLEIFESAKKYISQIRDGKGPILFECSTYRWKGHVGPSDDIDKGLRSQKELDHWKGRCPIRIFENSLFGKGILTPVKRQQVFNEIDEAVSDAVDFAEHSILPSAEMLENDVYRKTPL